MTQPIEVSSEAMDKLLKARDESLAKVELEALGEHAARIIKRPDNEYQSWAPLMEATIGALSATENVSRITEIGIGFGTFAMMKMAEPLGIDVFSVEMNHGWFEKFKEVPTEAAWAPMGEPEYIRTHAPKVMCDIAFVDGVSANRVMCVNYFLRLKGVKAILIHDSEDSSIPAYHWDWISWPPKSVDKFHRLRYSKKFPNTDVICRDPKLIEEIKGRLDAQAHNPQT